MSKDHTTARHLISDLLALDIGNELQDALLRQLETWTNERMAANCGYKVYGWLGYRSVGQTREVVAAKSKAAAARDAGEKDTQKLFNLCETGDSEELATASAEPGIVFWHPLDQLQRDREWTKA